MLRTGEKPELYVRPPVNLYDAVDIRSIFNDTTLNDSHFKLLLSQIKSTFDTGWGSRFSAYMDINPKIANILIEYGQVEIARIKIIASYGVPIKINHNFSSYEIGETEGVDVYLDEFLDILMNYAKSIKKMTPNLTKEQRAIFANLYDIAHHYTRGELFNTARELDDENKVIEDLAKIACSKHNAYWQLNYVLTNLSGEDVIATEDAPQEWLEAMMN